MAVCNQPRYYQNSVPCTCHLAEVTFRPSRQPIKADTHTFNVLLHLSNTFNSFKRHLKTHLFKQLLILSSGTLIHSMVFVSRFTYLSNHGGMQGWVDLVGWLCGACLLICGMCGRRTLQVSCTCQLMVCSAWHAEDGLSDDNDGTREVETCYWAGLPAAGSQQCRLRTVTKTSTRRGYLHVIHCLKLSFANI